MPNMKQICLVLVVVCALFSTATAQDSSSSTQRSTLTITAAATGERVRITAPSSVVQMHVEVYASSGEKLFDQEIRGGNVFDWHLQDGQAQRLAPGAYVCVVTAKSVSGKITQKLGTVTVAEKSASVQSGSLPLSLQQMQAIGPVEVDSSWTIAGENEPQTPTVIANDGKEGQMIRGRGALTFRIGNFFSGIDTEQMRLTEAGDLGIGTSQPQSKLDVAGTVRAQRFLVVKPDKLSSQAQADSSGPSTDSNSIQPLVSGVGTTGQLTKWTDGSSGALGDSIVTDSGNKIGIGTNAPSTNLHVFGNTGAPVGLRLENGGAGVSAESRFRIVADSAIGDILAQSVAQGQTVQFQGQNNLGMFINQVSNAPLAFQTNNTERMRILAGGNVGIGTTAPGMKLEVAGSNGAPANSGTVAKGALRLTGSSNSVLDFGSTGAAPFGNWLQSTDRSALGATYPLLLNPNGGNVGIGTTTPDSKLEVFNGVVTSSGPSGGRFLTRNPNNQSALVQLDWFNDGTHDWPRIRYGGLNEGATNGFLIQGPSDATKLAVLNNGNVGIGTTSPDTTLHVVNGASGIPSSNPNAIATLESNTTGYLQLLTPNASESGVLLGFPSGVTVGGAIIYNNPANADGLQFRTNFNHTRMVIDSSGNVGIGTTAPADKLHVNGILRVQTLGAADTTTALCRNSSNQIATCNSSSLRYKTAIEPFTGGLEIVNRLRPIRFTWKQGGARDLGLGAEEVAKVEPLLTFTNERGEIEGVKYDRLNVALINAIKEQQQQIAALRTRLRRLEQALQSRPEPKRRHR